MDESHPSEGFPNVAISHASPAPPKTEILALAWHGDTLCVVPPISDVDVGMGDWSLITDLRVGALYGDCVTLEVVLVDESGNDLPATFLMDASKARRLAAHLEVAAQLLSVRAPLIDAMVASLPVADGC